MSDDGHMSCDYLGLVTHSSGALHRLNEIIRVMSKRRRSEEILSLRFNPHAVCAKQ